jgi:hypothetical protein
MTVLCLHLNRVQGCSLLSVFASSPSTPPTAFCHLAGDAQATDCTTSSETASLPPHCYIELRNTFASQADGCSLLVIARVIDVKRCAIHVFEFEAAVAVRPRLSYCRQWLSRQAHTIVTLACNSLATAAASQAIALQGEPPPPPPPPPSPFLLAFNACEGRLGIPCVQHGNQIEYALPAIHAAQVSCFNCHHDITLVIITTLLFACSSSPTPCSSHPLWVYCRAL